MMEICFRIELHRHDPLALINQVEEMTQLKTMPCYSNPIKVSVHS